MNAPKPYGLNAEEDLRWECLRLAAAAIGMMNPMEVIASAEVFADYVKDGLSLGKPASVVKPEPGTNVVRLVERPA